VWPIDQIGGEKDYRQITSTRFKHTSSLSLESRVRSVENGRQCSVNTVLSALPTGDIADLPDGVIAMVAKQSSQNFYGCSVETTRQQYSI